jgi:hypothetical protein
MTSKPSRISYVLLDGSINGPVKVSMSGWTGVVFRFSRKSLKALSQDKNRADLKQSGIYFLFGESDTSQDGCVYIGQASERANKKGLIGRLAEHERDAGKNYWYTTVCFTTEGNSLGQSSLCFLENRLCELAREAQRFEVKNSNTPNAGCITEDEKYDFNATLEKLVLLVGILGFKVFEPLVSPLSESGTTYYITRSGSNAQAKMTDEGMVVLKGSVIAPKQLACCPKSAALQREKYEAKHKLDSDVLFKTPSAAACFVIGSSANGWTEWKTKDGTTLSDDVNRGGTETPDPEPPEPAAPAVYCIQTEDGIAKAIKTENGMTVLKGSFLRKKQFKSCAKQAVAKRAQHGTDSPLKEDVLFTSPSTAASFVLGRSADGRLEWKTPDGKRTLKEVCPESSKKKIEHKDEEERTLFTQTEEESELFYIRTDNGVAKARKSGDGMMILKGSVIGKKQFSSCPKGAAELRAKYKDSDLGQDLWFPTPSAAASFVLGRTANGYAVWKTKDGRTFDEVYPRKKDSVQ